MNQASEQANEKIDAGRAEIFAVESIRCLT